VRVLLSWKPREYDFSPRIVGPTADVNSSMPVFTANRISEALNRRDQPLRGVKALVLGAQDCVCLAVAHTAFDLPWPVRHARLSIDAAGATRRVSPAPGTVVGL
jgi:hypothetical protein